MSQRERRLAAFYVATAVVALVVTWWNNIDFLANDGGLLDFIDAAFSNPAAASLGFDVVFVAMAAQVFMFVEGRRVGVRHVWAYLVAGFAIAIAVAFPLFLAARQRRLGSAA